MQWTDRIRQVKILLACAAVFICAASLLWSHFLVSDLSKEERTRMEIWAEAMRSLQNADEDTDVALVLTVINGNHTIPVIVQDDNGHIQSFRNLRLKAQTAADTTAEVERRAAAMKQAGRVIRFYMDDQAFMDVCYDESIMLKRLASYPYIQLGIVFVFVVVAIFALLSSKRAEQNKVWVGLSKETAHQLGTPISSLMAWTQVL